MGVEGNQIKGIDYETGQPVSLTIQEGKISDIQRVADNPTSLSWLGPGLVDLQINGYGGHDLNTHPLDDHTVTQITRRLWREGVTTYYPTVITNSVHRIENAMRTISKACARDQRTARSIAGIHLEGPFISPEDGARGAHGKSYVRKPEWSLFQRWQEAAEGRIRLITLSPEWPDATRFISRCVESGVTVSIGHTSATPEQIGEAVAAGARMSTHLGNGSHLMLPRHRNYLWEQLAADELWACVIADGFHLPQALLKTILRTKGHRAMLVSDAVYLCGMPPGKYETHIGGRVVLTAEGKLHLEDHPQLLAGSAQTLLWAIIHLVKSGLATLPTAWQMASERPSAFMGLPTKSGIRVGAPADVVLFTQNEGKIEVTQTFKDGERVYKQTS